MPATAQGRTPWYRQALGANRPQRRQKSDESNYRFGLSAGMGQARLLSRVRVLIWNGANVRRRTRNGMNERLGVGLKSQADCFRGRQRVEDARDNLSSSRAVDVVNRPGLEQFGLSEHSTELIVQPVKELLQQRVERWGSPRCVGRPCQRRFTLRRRQARWSLPGREPRHRATACP